MYHVRPLTAPAEILAFLTTDRAYAAYAIGDLEPEFFAYSTWYAAYAAAAMAALALVYTRLEPPVLFLMGPAAGAAALLDHIKQPQVYLMVQEHHLPALAHYYRWQTADICAMWRMILTPDDFQPGARDAAVVLTSADIDRLRALYALGGGDAFTPEQLAQGVFYGIAQGNELIAAAGTHIVSPTYGVAAIGNVMTHPAWRGQGLATRVTHAVCHQLFQRGLTLLALNVAQDNPAAIRAYEKIGFARRGAFYEGIVTQHPCESSIPQT